MPVNTFVAWIGKMLPVLCGGLLLLAAGPVQARGQELSEVSFIPQWQPQAQFAGYYVAYEKGFYREHGLKVKIWKGGPDYPPSEMLATGRADLGSLMLSTGIIRRSRGMQLVNVAQIVQRSALMLVAMKSSGIKGPLDLNGKKVGLWGEDFQGQPRAFFRKYGLKVQIVPQSATLNLFLRGGVQVASAMWYNEYHQIIEAGVDPEELTTFGMADQGLDIPEDGIYCRQDWQRQHPEACRAFVAASLEGWQYAFAHPQEALSIVMRYVNAAHVATNQVHQKWMLARMRDIIVVPEHPLGVLQEQDYQRVADELQESGLIKAIPDFAQFSRSCASRDEK